MGGGEAGTARARSRGRGPLKLFCCSGKCPAKDSGPLVSAQSGTWPHPSPGCLCVVIETPRGAKSDSAHHTVNSFWQRVLFTAGVIGAVVGHGSLDAPAVPPAGVEDGHCPPQ